MAIIQLFGVRIIQSEVKVMAYEGLELTVFSWTEKDVDGYGDARLGVFNDISEIDLSDDGARGLIEQISNRLEKGEHVTLRIAKGGE